MSSALPTNTGIAIVGMAGRFPKARHIDEFWRNLCNGVEGISFFTHEELAASGVAVPKDDPNYVKARGVLEGADLFDAAFFGFTPREAEVMDPQHRVFLECAWEALEDAACDPARFDGAIGVFAGMSMNTYLAHNVLTHPEILAQFGESHLIFSNDKDYLTTRVSYKLNLRGPSLNIQTACSTSLVAVCVACQNLLAYECDMALAGGVSISFPQQRAYFYQEGGIGTPDGHCRAFDAKAAGTVAGEGVGIVVLKRLADALADGDAVYAVIKGFAINNDGSQKIGYTAPGVEGQAGVIATAQAMAGFDPETIGYIEAHGTGTPLGDPIEIEGLTKAFAGTTAKNFCAIGAVKSNVGHLDTAAGVTGLIKTVLALHHQKLPPNLHFESPNPKIDFANSPFFVNGALTEWTKGRRPRRAGVSSFGIGGTNAHVVLEESPAIKPSGKSQRPQLLLLSAKTKGALDKATANLAGHLQQHPELDPADVAYTLQTGRREFAHRRMLVCREVSDAVAGLASLDETRVFTGVAQNENPPVVFMFPGQGAQQVNMALELYETEPTFREQIDLCCEILKPHLGFDLRTTIYPEAARIEEAPAQLTRTSITQPALFVVEYALAKLWMSWGVQPEVMIGHSIGEYVAACLAGVFSLEDSLKLVAARGRMMQEMPPGAMLAVRLPEPEIMARLHGSLSLSAVNGAAACVVAGPYEAIEELRRDLAQHEVVCTVLRTSHAFHSAMMDPMLDPFRELVGALKLKAPELPFISNVTGALITANEATDPMYWARHLRQTVRFADGLGELLRSPERIFLETGPGQTLSGLAKLHPARNPKTLVCASLPRSSDISSALEATLTSLGQMWLAGATVNWHNFHHHEQRRPVRLPTYPFERKRHFIEPASAQHDARLGSGSPFIPALSDVKPDSGSCSANFQLIPVRSSNGQKTGRDAVRDDANGGRVAQEPQSNGNGKERDQLARFTTRKERIAAGIAKLLGELSGLNIASTNGTVTFTEMGFDSLFLTQASLAIEKKFGVRVAFRQLLKEFSSVDALAGHIDSVLPSEQPEPARPNRGQQGTPLIGSARERGNGVVTVPVTESQRELWLASKMSDAASCAYSECRLLHLRGPLKADALRTALQQLVNRHEALRTTFDSDGQSQHIHPALKLDVPVVDLTELDAEARASRWDAIQAAESRRVFDLSNGPLIRAQLIRLSEQEHVLMLTIYHIVCDGHSFGILLRELAAIYSAETRGVPSGLPAPLQLSEFVNAQTRSCANNGRPDDEAYWVKRFAGGAPMLELPTDRPRPALRTFDGARASRRLPATLARDLKRVAAQNGCTWFTTLLAGCFGLLRRLSGQREIVIGIPIADRAMEGGDTLVGHCINFLPLRATVMDDQSCTEHLVAVQEAFLDAHEHQHFTYGSLVQKLNLPRDGNRLPLVSVTFNAARLDGDLIFDGLETGLATNAHSLTNFDLSFDVSEMNGAVQLDCRCNKNVFAAETVERWLGHFQTLLEAIAANPRQRVFELPLLTDAQREQILVEWNNTRTDYPTDQTVAQLFEEQVARTPEGFALEFDGAKLTYRELNERANQLAHHLQKRGVGPDVLVAVWLERSLYMIVSLLGILKAGGAYLPLDLAHPKERLALMLEETHAPIVLTQDKLRGFLPETGDAAASTRKNQMLNPTIISLDSGKEEIGREPMTNPVSKATAESLAYISFTSGSIGRPKGVCVPHRAVVRLVRNTNYASFAATGVFLQLAPLAFDASTFEIWGPLLNGARLVIFPPHAPSLAELGECIQQRGITTLWLTSGLFHHMIEEQSHSLRGLHQLLAGGDVLSVPHVKRALEALPDCRLINGYGPTENTTFTCCHQITSASVEGRSIPIGRPISNTQVYVLDANLRPVPIGVPGELYTGGDGLARGYLNQPELAAEKFIPNPFSNDPRARLYKTGDLARWLLDGSIEFLGRLDAQVKIRGNRVELSEIETVLTRHPAVRECVVVARKDRLGDKQLTAYFVSPDAAPPAAEALREHLRRALPDYMVPFGFVRLQSLPLTANGKVDRKALPDPGEPEIESREPSVIFNDDFEKQLAEIWQDVLGLCRVGAGDDFFELGGHSLLALRLIARVETVFGKRIPVATVFHTRTVAQMANLLREKSQPPRATSIVEIQPQGSRPPLMLVHGAGGGMLWGYTALAQHLGTDQPVYAFKSRGLDGQEEFVTIEEVAAHYVADLRAFQPQGPYYLGGYCFGGNVAFEMARQLHAQGERIALLALLNSIPPNSAYDHAVPSPVWLARFVGNLCYFIGCLLRRPGPELRLFIGWYARTFTRKIARLFSRRPPSGVMVDELVDLTAYPPEQRRLWRTHIQALFQHHTKLHAGRVTLLRSRGHPFWCSFDYAYGWRAFAGGGSAVHLVPGAHEQILDEPHVSVLAEELRGELARAQNDEPSATNARPGAGASQPDAAKVPTASVIPSPRIEPPVELVQNRKPSRPLQAASSIVEIQPNGSKPPLFLVHGIGGGMLWGYANLARFLGPDQPVYAFNSRGLDGHEEFGTIEEMAAQYVAELRTFQPEGSYRLGGYCFGGNVAYEMARLLEAQGQTVSLLAMFNCPLPNSSYYRVRLTPGFCFKYLKNFTNRLKHVLRLKPEQRRTLVLWRGRVLKKQCFNVFNRFRGVKTELGANDWVDLATQPEDRRELWAIHLHAYNGYQPKPYGGPVTLFRTHDHPLICSFDDACGWRKFVAGGVTVHIVPGEHESTLDVPHVKSVAKILEKYLQPTTDSYGVRTAQTPIEKNQVPVEWNQTQADYPREKCVHHLFEEQVGRTPQAVAVVSTNEQMTYAELNRRADQVAERLRSLGIGPDVPVGICLERSLEMVIGVLAVLKAGGAYLPLDPAYPTERLNLMIENSRSPLVLTQRELQKQFKSGNSSFQLMCIKDLLEPTSTNESRTRTRTRTKDERTPQSSDLAYVIHTSGSTGTPKGVAMPHRPLVNLIAWQVRNSKLPPGARTLQFASLNFDVSFQEMFSTWCAGGTLVLVNENLRRDPVALWRFIRENKIARLFMPFVALQQLAEAFKPEKSGEWALREIITAGEQLQTTPALVRMFERLTDCTLHNQYGPSESHVVTAFALSGPPGQWPALPSIGRPIANTQIYLLDEQRQRVPVGVPGELYIGGDCLARGYLHQPDLTAGRFIPNPFSDDAEARLYKTGDLARYQPDGNIEFLGRTDQQIKIRGFRIELGEIEATLRRHPKIRDAVVMARADQPGQKRLVAYYISQPEPPCTSEELRLFLKEKLPEYMVPTAFASLEVFPLTPSGKVARNRLPAPEHSRHDLPENFAPPSTPTQQALAKIWCDVLGLPQIGIHDDFFELGGNSILAVQAIARMSELFGIELPVSGLFEAPTIAQAAEGLPDPPCDKERHETDRQPALAH